MKQTIISLLVFAILLLGCGQETSQMPSAVVVATSHSPDNFLATERRPDMGDANQNNFTSSISN